MYVCMYVCMYYELRTYTMHKINMAKSQFIDLSYMLWL